MTVCQIVMKLSELICVKVMCIFICVKVMCILISPGRVIQKSLKMVEMAACLGAQGCGVSIMTDWLVSG